MLKYIEEFKVYLQSQNCAKNTILAYLSDINDFHIYLIKENRDNIHSIDKEIIRAYLIFLMENHISNRSISRKVSSIKVFCKFLLINDYLSINPAKYVKTPKYSKKLPVFFSVEEIFELCDLPVSDNKFGIRDKALFEMFYSSGLRISEVADISIKDIDFKQNLITVIGKGSKKRVVPITISCIEKLNNYLKIRDSFSPEDTEILFVSKSGKQLDRNQLYAIMKKYINQISSKSGYSPHTIRHTFASHLLQNGADLLSIKEMLGHSNLSTTEIYTHINPENVRSEYLRGHPRAKNESHNNENQKTKK
ncbi:MAG: tyrosine-type recombinase/integrase [Candidatus Cloacimonetes bacterium]|jgi:site-specific recombinase XerD|nr:tyrosine-type recombinase/integrase [Candidatus Cloacimonadota bacterium]MDD4155170.1 tyrosine-type recombinase/integrase [Candidatus Cloacimonadota bacterium]